MYTLLMIFVLGNTTTEALYVVDKCATLEEIRIFESEVATSSGAVYLTCYKSQTKRDIT